MELFSRVQQVPAPAPYEYGPGRSGSGFAGYLRHVRRETGGFDESIASYVCKHHAPIGSTDSQPVRTDDFPAQASVLAKREGISLDPRVQEFNREGVRPDVAGRLADQLVQPLVR